MQTIENGGYIFHISDTGEAALAECTAGAALLTIPAAAGGHPVTEIEYDAFEHAGDIGAFAVEPGHPCFSVTDGVLMSRDGQTLIHYPNAREQTFYAVPDTVRIIKNYAFSHADRLRKVLIPEGVTEIASHAFDGCGSLESIRLPATLAALGLCVFRGCSSLSRIEIPDGHPVFRMEDAFLLDLRDSALVCCLPALATEEMTVPRNVVYVDEYAFYGCDRLERVHFHHGLRNLGRYAFYHCANLRSVELQDGLRSIGTRSFSGCSGLRLLYVPDSVTSIEYKAFNNCPKLYLSINKGSYAARYCRQFGFPCKFRIRWPWTKD